MKQFIIVCVVFLVGLLLRTLWLDRIPSAIAGDELIYILEAKSIALWGTDLTHTWHPLSALLFRYPPDQMQAELPYFLNVPVVGSMPFSLFAARITSAVLSAFTVVGLYFFVRELFSPTVGIVVAAVLALNPWAIYIGRTAYEVVPSAFFYIWAMYLMIAKRGKWMLWSIPFFIAAFYSYIGTKVIFLPLILLMIWYVWMAMHATVSNRRLFILATVSVLFMSFFAYQLFTADHSRVSDIIRLQDPLISREVDTLRKASLGNPLNELFINKYTVFAQIVSTKMLKILSTQYLFGQGDAFFSLYNHGFFYRVDFIFLCIGSLALFIAQRKKAFFVTALIALGMLPHILHSASTNDFSPHLSMFFLFLSIPIGYGIYSVFSFVAGKYRIALGVAVGGIYLFSLGNFYHMYVFTHSVSGQFDWPIRVASRYIGLQQRTQSVDIYTPRTTDVYKKFLFYTNAIQKDTLPSIAESLQESVTQMGNVTFYGCDANVTPKKGTTVVVDALCGKPKTTEAFVKITRWKDGGEDFFIYNDSVCREFALSPYAQGWTLNDLHIEQLTVQRFCEAFVAR